MSDILNVTGSNYTSGSIERGESSVQRNTGALRRKYNFGDMLSELALAQDPFFRFVSMVSKKPTDDPQFKFTEKRSSYTKRYAYLSDFSSAAISVPATDPSTTGTTSAGDVYTFSYFCDYNSNGNLQNVFGQTVTLAEGSEGTQPQFFIPGQIIKIPHGSTAANADAGTTSGYTLWKINSVDLDTLPVSASAAATGVNKAVVNATCVKGSGSAVFFMNAVSSNSDTTDAAAGLGHNSTLASSAKSQEFLEPFKSYVVGTAFGAGTGYPETWQDQPYTTGHGMTQIWKTSCVMNNTDRATALKYEANEWARIWKEKLIEHKWDIEQALLFGSQSETYGTTEGAVNFISTYGNAFSLSLATKTQDSFLDDLSAMLDPRYNNAASTVFFCSTAVYNWLHKLGGYFQNNIEVSPNYRADFSISGKKKVFGIDITTISTIYGDMNVARNVHLDGTNIKMMGINMKYCAYRPLVGNGLNRDTGVYVGVQTLENSGVDRRVDQILTEAGMEWCCPETHALWT
tara:strand:- start:762 stop:2306 length:1545 start_codon:yes stop_codon:yes gene_type:complete